MNITFKCCEDYHEISLRWHLYCLAWPPTEAVLHPLHLSEHPDHALLRRHAHAVQQLHALPQELGHGHRSTLHIHTLYTVHYTTHISHYRSHLTTATPCWWLPPAPACPRSATRAPRRSSPCRRRRSKAVKIITIFEKVSIRTWILCNFREISLRALNNTMDNLSGYLYLIVVLLPLEQLITNCG